MPPLGDDTAVALLHAEAHTIVMKTIFEHLLESWGLRLLVVLSLTLAAQSLASAQEEKLYYFVDEHGVPHISNTPSDPRYKPYTPGKRGEHPPASSRAEDHSAPEEQFPSPVEAPDESLEPPDEDSVPAEEPPQNGKR